jgi:hypothetical protein
LLSRSRDWLRRHRDDGQRALGVQTVCDVFPRVPPPDLVHVLVATEERTSTFVDIIVTCLTCALVLDGLDDVGDPVRLALKRTDVLCVFTAALLLILARQNAKLA